MVPWSCTPKAVEAEEELGVQPGAKQMRSRALEARTERGLSKAKDAEEAGRPVKACKSLGAWLLKRLFSQLLARMKFGKQLERHKIRGWDEFYVDYIGLKTSLKASATIKAFIRIDHRSN